MIGARRIAGGWPNATVLFVDQFVVGQRLSLAVNPILTRLLMKLFREGFRKAIGNRLNQNRVVVVFVLFVLACQLVGPMACCDHESSEIILSSRIYRCDVIRERAEGFLAFAFPLLPEHAEAGGDFGSCFVRVDQHVVTVAGSGPEAINAMGLDQIFSSHSIEHLDGMGVKLFGHFADV